MRGHLPERGSSLLEAIIAVGILVSAVVSLAGLASIAIRAAADARDRSAAAALAAAKMDQLWLADRGGPASSPDAAQHNEPGFFEYVDGAGAVVDPSGPAGGLVFVRRWAVSPWGRLDGVRLVQVTVSRCRRGSGAPPGDCGDHRTAVTLVTFRSVAPP